RCVTTLAGTRQPARVQFGNPWTVLDELLARYELVDDVDFPFPLGGCFGYWGYELKNFVEPRLSRRAQNDLQLPDFRLGVYDSVVVFDHRLGKTWVVSTGLDADGSREDERARTRGRFWQARLAADVRPLEPVRPQESAPALIASNVTRAGFLARVSRIQD